MQAWGRGAEVKLYPFFNLCARWGLVVNYTPWLLYPQERALVLTVQEVGWASELSGQVWKSHLNNLQQSEYNCQAVVQTKLLVCNKSKGYPLDTYTELRMYCLFICGLLNQTISNSNCTSSIQCVYKWMVQYQKITRNLFLTLHGQNVHRQQRQLSKFRMCYQQFNFHAYCRATGSVYKMAPQQEKAFYVLSFEVSRSVITVQREFCAWFRLWLMHAFRLC